MRSGFRFLFSYHSILLLVVGLGVVSVALFSRPPQSVPPPLSVQPSLSPQSRPPDTTNNGSDWKAGPPPAAESDIPSGATQPDVTPVQVALPDVSAAGTLVPAPSTPPPTQVAAQAGDTIDFDSMRLVSNQWGAPPNEQLTCAVFRNHSKTFGWYWSRQQPKLKQGSSQVLPIYPSIRVGGNHREQSKIASFPVRMSDIKSLDSSVDYSYREVPTGTFNLSYDFFLLDTDRSGPSATRKAEIMIWLQATLGQPPETYRGDFTDGHNTYALYSFTMSDGRLYYAFVMTGNPQFPQRVNVKKLLDQIHLDPNWYIPGIELGNEVVNGSGKIEISQFSVNLNGTMIGAQ